jgi:hypothetical protein
MTILLQLTIDSSTCVRFEVAEAQFWWPVGLGKQPLYKVTGQLIRQVCASYPSTLSNVADGL